MGKKLRASASCDLLLNVKAVAWPACRHLVVVVFPRISGKLAIPRFQG